MRFAVEVLIHTPIWVWPLFAYLVWQGILALRPREVPVWRLLIVPAAFLIMSLSRFALAQEQGLWPFAVWLFVAVLVAPLGLTTGPKLLAVDRIHGRVTRVGSKVPLIRNVVVFILQYAVAATSAVNPESHATLLIIGRAISGATAGYFIGWVVSLWRRYRQAGKD